MLELCNSLYDSQESLCEQITAVMSATHFPRRLCRIVTIAVISALFLITVSYGYLSSASTTSDAALLSVQNSTLGFGATILISLPERTDRRDAISLLTSLSSISITHTVAAVNGDVIVDKAKPYGKARTELDAAHFGSWRSHMDALKYVVDNRIETALILEDDVDW